MRPTFEDLKAIWLLCHSRAAFIDARRWLDEMETARNDSHNEALVYAAVVAYCRPFTKSQVTQKQRVIPLDGVLPPQHLADAHENLLLLRDKIIGHRDAVPTEGYSRSANPLLLDRFDSTYRLNTSRLGEMLPEQRKAAKELCAYFVTHCETRLSAVTRKYRGELLRYPEGEYELLLTEPPDDWIKQR
jgi:hypothetical protein